MKKAIPFAAVLLACSGDAPRARPAEPTDSVLRQAVESGQLLALREDWRIGGVGDGAASFFRVRGVAVDSAGTVYVLDAGNHRVVVFDATGQPLRDFGRQGEGPGEFVDPVSLSLARDTVVVADENNRLHLFEAGGRHIRTRVYRDLAMQGDGWHTGAVTGVSGGWLVTATAYFRNAANASRQRLPPLTRLELHWLDETGDLTPSGFHWEHQPEGVWHGMFWIQAPYPYRPAWAVDGLGRVHVADSGSYTIAVYGSDGRYLRRVHNDVPRLPLDAEAIGEWRAAYECRVVGECAPGGVELALSLPRSEFKPVVWSMAGFPQGHIAVRRADLDPNPFDTRIEGPWDMFDPEGRFLGSLPGSFTPRWFDGHVLITTERGAMDEEYLVRYVVDSRGGGRG